MNHLNAFWITAARVAHDIERGDYISSSFVQKTGSFRIGVGAIESQILTIPSQVLLLDCK